MQQICPIEITEEAKSKILQIREAKKISPEYMLRVGVKGAGCGIGDFLVGFDLVQEQDEVFEDEDVKVLIRKSQLMYLIGLKLDFCIQENGESGFLFIPSQG